MTILLLGLDLDGTMLRDHDKSIAPEDLAAIERARDHGLIVTIITGRLYGGTRDAAQQAGIQGPVACADGCHIVDASTHAPLALHVLEQSCLHQAYDLACAQPGVWCYGLEPEQVIHEEGAPHLRYLEMWTPSLMATPRLKEASERCIKLVAVGPRASIEEAHRRVCQALGAQVSAFTFPATLLDNDEHVLLVRRAGLNKGTALAWLARHHGVAMSETAVVGDWLNDAPMFKVAGRAFVMGAAHPEVSALATDVLDAPRGAGQGGAQAIHTLLAR